MTRARTLRRPAFFYFVLSVAVFVSFFLAKTASGQTQLGGPGHFMHYNKRIHLFNPTGESFTVTVHGMKFGNWGPGEGFNKSMLNVKISDPNGTVLTEGKQDLKNGKWTYDVPAGPKGVYKVEPENKVYVESSLDHSVLYTGHPDKHIIEGRRAVFAATVPRRWWFWVPEDVNRFTVTAQRAGRYMSQREDWAFHILSPRGQRMKALVGQPPYHEGPYQQEQKVTVPVEPGTTGRFWSILVDYGDSHNYSNINFALKGVPPYIARSPEEWFNPEKGGLPDVPLYDETPFIQAAPKTEMMENRWPNLEHFSPAPSLGDPDGIQMRGDGRFALWNQGGRKLKFRIGSYLPRKEDGQFPEAHVRITGPDGQPMLDETRKLTHVHNKGEQPEVTLDTEKGVSKGTVTGGHRWFLFTYPGTPLVMTPRNGNRSVEEWSAFRFSSGTTRNWYFYVPEGTSEFQLRFDAMYDTDVIEMKVCAPNMKVAQMYSNRAGTTVEVPEGLDGRIWYIRSKIGESTTIRQDGTPYRYQQSPMTVELKGVPPYLAPTWEQWFHLEHPKKPLDRGSK